MYGHNWILKEKRTSICKCREQNLVSKIPEEQETTYTETSFFKQGQASIGRIAMDKSETNF